MSDWTVVFIGTEKYLDFLPSWYERCEENFLPGVDKKYLVFTDGDVPETPDNAIVYKQEHLEWSRHHTVSIQDYRKVT